MTLIEYLAYFLLSFIFGFVTIYLIYDKKETIGFIILDEKD